ncbi:MAG: DNA-protecting protein DprA, partial [Armatimonadetes bacterium]|nr:DNA-protecting protein DprA [Armatimonadota bacterium]
GANFDRLAESAGWDGWDAERTRLRHLGARVLTLADPEYPSRLREIHDPPPVLYARGDLTAQDEYAVAVVGSRRATDYGLRMAHEIAARLARAGVVVVSGLARGVDAAAHRGALAAGGRTLAVLGCGVDTCYPAEHARLRDEIAAAGAVLSEFALGAAPDRWRFPARNRVISGLCLGTVLIEAPADSGAMITADFALEQGREVFAVPGNVDTFASRGCNRLIKEGAALVECAEDILEALNLSTAALAEESPAQPPLPLPLPPEAERVFSLLGPQQKHVDAIAAESGLPTGPVLSALTLLEMTGVVRRLAGNFYVRVPARR